MQRLTRTQKRRRTAGLARTEAPAASGLARVPELWLQGGGLPRTVDDRDIWFAALNLLIEEGVDARAHVQRRLAAALERGDEADWQVWAWVAEAMDELLRPKPRRGEWLQ